jgi:hypothetical protein
MNSGKFFCKGSDAVTEDKGDRTEKVFEGLQGRI